MRMLQSSKLLVEPNHKGLLVDQQPLRRIGSRSRLMRACISCKLSRRELSITSLLLAGSQALLPAVAAAAETYDILGSCTNKAAGPMRRAFLDISIDGEPVGRITVGIYEESSPVGASRFIDLVSGRAGAASYRRKEFLKVMPEYVQHGGVRSPDLDNKALKQQLALCQGSQGPTILEAGSLALVVRDPSKPPPKPKLVARGGKLQMEEEEIGVEPNGTQFLICTKECPPLIHDSALLIGTVLQGMDVLERVAHLPTVQDNTTSPYFRVAKLIGDKRAVVAERGFNRPYSKVLVTNCGLLE